MKILIIEPFFTGSHQIWAEGYKEASTHNIKLLSLPGRFWKWRMHGGAVTLAKQFRECNFEPDLILATDMLNLPIFLSLTNLNCPCHIYFHENQITYPWSPNDIDVENGRDKHYGFINYSSALCADHIYFNSNFHLDSFFIGLHKYLKKFPDYNEIQNIKVIKEKSSVLNLGINLKKFNNYKINKNSNNLPLILWNHRWEYDKNPDLFFNVLIKLSEIGDEFQIAVLGTEFEKELSCFSKAKDLLNKHIVQFGFIQSFKEYSKWLWKADILPVTSNQDFFGTSIMEAVYCKTIPLLPKRLTYPDLFELKNNPNLFYNDENDLFQKLRFLIKNTSKPIKHFQHIAKKYDWTIMGKSYDNTFEQI